MDVAIVMPAFNEEEGIASFLEELNSAIGSKSSPAFIVINDASSDNTEGVARALEGQGLRVKVITNSLNSGHGISTIRALRQGLATECPVIVGIDGDGQFIGEDVRGVIDALVDNPELQVVEGVRIQRHDPIYRRLTSWATCSLVWSRSGVWPSDANTPLRAYRREYLEDILARIPDEASTPNLLISALTRRSKVVFAEIPVRSIPRRGVATTGTTWGRRAAYLPTSRFLRFCGRATRDWLTTSLN